MAQNFYHTQSITFDDYQRNRDSYNDMYIHTSTEPIGRTKYERFKIQLRKYMRKLRSSIKVGLEMCFECIYVCYQKIRETNGNYSRVSQETGTYEERPIDI